MKYPAPDPLRDFGLKTMTIPTICVICEILANCYIIWFLLVDFPMRCNRLAAETAGQQTCGMETGAYLIAVVSAIMILGGVYYLAKWYFPQRG
jgi:hypothetical protein